METTSIVNARADQPAPDSACTVLVAEPTVYTIPATFSRITATNPPVCTKSFFMPSDGKGGRLPMRKETKADVYEGDVERVEVDSLAAFAEVLKGLGTNQCLTYGAPALPKVKLTTKDKWERMGFPDTHVPRTKNAFSWTPKPGIFMLDYDAPKDGTPVLSREELVAAVRKACPGLADAAMLWWPSTGSCIWNAETNEELVGIRGQRLYILVREASDIERAGKALDTLLWAAGHGRFEVGDVGQKLEKGLFDKSVWQSNRIDFAAGAKCTAPLEQRRGDPVLIPGSVEFVNTRSAIPSPPQFGGNEAADANKRAAKAKIMKEAEEVTERCIEKGVAKLIANNPAIDEDDARATVRRAFERDVLAGDWLVVVEGKPVTVGEILDNPKQYHSKQTLDPIEPEYDGGRAVGKLYLFGASPNLYSFAHGGKTYRLERQPARVVVAKGREREYADETLDRMRVMPDLFDYSDGGLVAVDAEGRMAQYNDAMLHYRLAGAVRYVNETKEQMADGSWKVEERSTDVPGKLPANLIRIGPLRKLRPLTAVITAPTLRPDGTVLDQPGYDAATKFLLHFGEDDPMPVPEHPTKEQAKIALRTLWHPFEKFPFAGPLDRAAHLAALLTAVVRPSLKTAPAFGYDAPTFGSGKTLLARCVGVVAGGAAPVMLIAPPGLHAEEEMKKLLLSTLREDPRAVVFDNIMGAFNSGGLSKVLTSETHNDRILGGSANTSLTVKAMFMLTGNNLTLAGDMPRRVLVCRIDPRVESPFTRRFDLDPERYCLANRQMLVGAALLLIRYYLTSGAAEPGAGRMASFEDWDRWVRQTVLYVDRTIEPGKYGDVMELVMAAQASDPEQEMLGDILTALRDRFGEKWFTAKEVAESFNAGRAPSGSGAERDKALRAAFADFSTGRDEITAKTVGRVITHRVGRIARGLHAEALRDRSAEVWKYRVVVATTAARGGVVVGPWSAEGEAV